MGGGDDRGQDTQGTPRCLGGHTGRDLGGTQVPGLGWGEKGPQGNGGEEGGRENGGGGGGSGPRRPGAAGGEREMERTQGCGEGTQEFGEGTQEFGEGTQESGSPPLPSPPKGTSRAFQG